MSFKYGLTMRQTSGFGAAGSGWKKQKKVGQTDFGSHFGAWLSPQDSLFQKACFGSSLGWGLWAILIFRILSTNKHAPLSSPSHKLDLKQTLQTKAPSWRQSAGWLTRRARTKSRSNLHWKGGSEAGNRQAWVGIQVGDGEGSYVFWKD